jgi:hypothetical protein
MASRHLYFPEKGSSLVIRVEILQIMLVRTDATGGCVHPHSMWYWVSSSPQSVQGSGVGYLSVELCTIFAP